MSFKILTDGSGKAMSLQKKGDSATGFLLEVKTDVGEYNSSLYTLQAPNGSRFQVWGNFAMDEAFLNGEGLKEEFIGCLIRVTVTNTRKVKKGKRELIYRDIRVECDDSKRVKVVKKPVTKIKK